MSRIYATDPNSAPAPAVTPIASALQKVTRIIPGKTFAPPVFAAKSPKKAKEDSLNTAGISHFKSRRHWRSDPAPCLFLQKIHAIQDACNVFKPLHFSLYFFKKLRDDPPINIEWRSKWTQAVVGDRSTTH